jgi:tetratricopeptide (TPR) repeat protein
VGKEVEAMEAMNSYLSKQNQGDAAAWFEMANLCTNVGDYKGATCCYEELVLLQPQDASLHCMLGELYLMMGSSSSLLSNLIPARKHIALSLELSGDSSNNLRALYALVDAASYLELVEASNNNNKKVEDKEVQVAKALLQFGVDRILKSYKGTSMFAVVKDAIDGCLELLTQS